MPTQGGVARLVMDRVIRLRRRGKDEDALVLARRFARLRPRDPFAWTIWGDLLLQQHRPLEAEQVLRSGMSQVETSELTLMLVEALCEQGKLDEAVALANSESRFNGDPARLTSARAVIASTEGDWSSFQPLAEEAIRQTDGLEPELAARIKYRLGRVFLFWPDGRGLQRGKTLLKECAPAMTSAPMPNLLLGVAEEGEDAELARFFLARAEQLWGVGRSPTFAEALDEARAFFADRPA